MCVNCKSKKPRGRTHRIALHWMPLRRPDPTVVIRAFNFAKKHVFNKKLEFCSFDTKLDARTQHWSVPEEAELAVVYTSFTFLQNFFKNGRA